MAEWDVQFETDLTAQGGTGNVAATEYREGDGHAGIELILTSTQALQLVFTQAFVVGHGPVCLHAEGDARAEVVGQRNTSRVDVAAHGLNTQNAGTGIPCKKKSEVGIDTSLV